MRTLTQWLNEAGGMDRLIDVLVPDHRQVKRMSHGYARQHHGHPIRARAEEMGIEIEPHEVEKVLTHILGPEVDLPEFDIEFYRRHC